MKYIDEYRKKSLVGELIAEIKRIDTGAINLMEVCGTHTMAIFRSGLKQLLPKDITLISGPGCPVCVTDQADIDRMVALARVKNVIIATFGDMLRVPGTGSTLEKERSEGADIRIVYSPLDALIIARQNRDKQVVFLGVGFETTAPAVACAVEDAKRSEMNNFSVYSCHKAVPPAIMALLQTGEVKLDGFILPGHVSCVTGSKAYEFIADEYMAPCVISGFEPVDILESILMLKEQAAQKRHEVQIQYKRAVTARGNLLAQETLNRVFDLTDAAWRGLGLIRDSGYKLSRALRDFDARNRFVFPGVKPHKEPKACLCAEVLRGLKNPGQCRLFAGSCTPERPYGPCMVSSEGTCAAWFKYNR